MRILDYSQPVYFLSCNNGGSPAQTLRTTLKMGDWSECRRRCYALDGPNRDITPRKKAPVPGYVKYRGTKMSVK